MHHTLALIFSYDACHTLYDHYLTEEVFSFQGYMFLKLFLTLLCPLSSNGLQHKALVIRDAIIVVKHLINNIYT
jgi:hypothetical protein